jgi:hypothetical protein
MPIQHAWGQAIEPTLSALRGIRFVEGEGGSEPPAPKPFTPPASQEDLDRIISDRLARQKAGFADYDALKTAKDELDRIKAGQMSDLEKEKQRADAAEAARKAAEEISAKDKQELVRLTVAAQKGIAGDELKLLHGSTEQELADAADLIVKLRGKTPRRDPGQGATGDQPKVSAGLAEAQRRFGNRN